MYLAFGQLATNTIVLYFEIVDIILVDSCVRSDVSVEFEGTDGARWKVGGGTESVSVFVFGDLIESVFGEEDHNLDGGLVEQGWQIKSEGELHILSH